MEYSKEVVTEVLCPLVDRMIEDIDCIENRDIIDGAIVMSALPDEYKKKNDFIELCKNCKWHNY